MTLALRQELIETARALNRSGINQGTSGNLSVRLSAGDAQNLGCLITPSGMPYEGLVAEDLVELRGDGSAHGRRAPSSEASLHLAILRAYPEAQAVVHAHPTFATALSCHEQGIPAFHYMVAVAGGADIRCAAYATFGTPELAEHAVLALRDRRACLLSHHGLVAWGTDLASALSLAIEVETLARQYLYAKMLGPPPLLSDEEMARVVRKFEDYGRKG